MTAETRARILQEALEWKGTPYHYHARIKGVGADCAQFPIAVYQACGLIGDVDPGQYSQQWHLHNRQELFIEWIERLGGHEVDQPEPGDLITFRYAHTFSHGAIYLGDGKVIHANLNVCVEVTRLDEAPLQGRPARYWSML